MENIFTVVIPTLDEEQGLSGCIDRVRGINPKAEIIVVDGGSRDRTADIARVAGVIFVAGSPGRGVQCNRGGHMARGEIILFLHSDTLLPMDAFERIAALFSRPDTSVATFRLRFDVSHWLLDIYAFFTRFDSIWTRFGDQCIVVRRSFFEEIDGFPDWPLFEDVHFLQKARRRTRVWSMPAEVVTSARKFVRNGICRQQLRNMWLIWQYLLGCSPDRLAAKYRGSSPQGA